ncbi:MAG: hypothetical protein RIT27_2298 [Pseudomonadota bacterium]|jgi:hypothetical protein
MRKPLFLPRRYQQRLADIIPPTHGNGRREWVISRALCHYRCFDLREIPVNRRDAVLQTHIQQWNPFPEGSSFSVWKQGVAQTWVWDSSKIETAQLEQNLKNAYSIPETLFRSTLENGVQLLKCFDGIEGQIWRDNILIASRWWTQLPEIKEWQTFLRAYNATEFTDTPLQDSPFLEKPWGKARSAFRSSGLLQERWLIAVLAVISISAFMWEGIFIYKWYSAYINLQTEIAELNDKANPILAAKTQTINEQKHIERLLGLNVYPNNLEIMAKIVEKLPQMIKIIDWHYQTGEVSFTIEGAPLEPSYYVSTYQTIPLFSDVKSSSKMANQLTISMKVNKK